MRINVDTNVLVRLFNEHEAEQSALAQRAILEAEAIILTIPTLCEFVWVMTFSYKRSAEEVAKVLRALLQTEKVVVDRLVVEAGLAFLDAGGDFADGVIAYFGERLGANIFLSFDKRAVRLVHAQGGAARLLD